MKGDVYSLYEMLHDYQVSLLQRIESFRMNSGNNGEDIETLALLWQASFPSQRRPVFLQAVLPFPEISSMLFLRKYDSAGED
jgi:hypothetical protein